MGCDPIPQAKLDGILGTNYARMLRLDENEPTNGGPR